MEYRRGSLGAAYQQSVGASVRPSRADLRQATLVSGHSHGQSRQWTISVAPATTHFR
jgi:hypothetical protein